MKRSDLIYSLSEKENLTEKNASEIIWGITHKMAFSKCIISFGNH